MKLRHICDIKGSRQDGAISGNFLFSFDHLGNCTVYDLENINGAEPFSEFTLCKTDVLKPHSNSVVFGNEYFEAGDEFPLLYTNVYNNYQSEENKRTGMCLVYRILRNENVFTSELVQIIEIGFTSDENYWKSEGIDDLRPYGNFVVDCEKNRYYAFTMIDKPKITRYFAFDLPKLSEGEMCREYGVSKVVLNASDIKEYFDCDYHHFVQGACLKNGKIYSLEGFTNNKDNPPAIRIIDTASKKQIAFKLFEELGSEIEPECIDFCGDTCYYVNHNGELFEINWGEENE